MNSPKTIIPALITLMLFAVLYTTKQSFFHVYDDLQTIDTIKEEASDIINGLPDNDLGLEFFSALDENGISYLHQKANDDIDWHLQNDEISRLDFEGHDGYEIKTIAGRTYSLIRKIQKNESESYLMSLDHMLNTEIGVVTYDDELKQLRLKYSGDYGANKVPLGVLYMLANICLIWFLVQFANVMSLRFPFILALTLLFVFCCLSRMLFSTGSLNLWTILLNHKWASTLEFGLDAIFIGGLAHFILQNHTKIGDLGSSHLAKTIINLMAYILSIASMVWITQALTQSVLFYQPFEESELDRSFTQMMGLYLSLFFAIVACIAQFVLLYIVSCLNQSQSKLLKITLYSIALISVIIGNNMFDIPISDYALGLTSIALWVLMDLFVDKQKRSLLWTIVWILCFSLTYAALVSLMRLIPLKLGPSFFFLFAQMFMIGFLVVLVILIVDYFLKIIPDGLYRINSAFTTYYRRIELLTFATIFSFLVILFMSLMLLFVPYHKNVWKNQLNAVASGLSLFENDNFSQGLNDVGYDLAVYEEGILKRAYYDNHFFPPSSLVMEEASIDKVKAITKSIQGQSKFDRAYLKISDGGSISYISRAWKWSSNVLTISIVVCLFIFGISQLVWRQFYEPLYKLKADVNNITKDSAKQIEWAGDDEIGLLIQKYNDLIKDIKTDADQTIKNEKEYAWREMAKQVAHEIKNPLTPMKLTLQYLVGRIDRVDSEDEAKEIVQSSSRTLIEQIENLANIANSFSNFARMPRPEFEETNLNDLLANVHNLFSSAEQTEFNLYVPIDDMSVMADRNHLLQVLNNLMKNAIQAIPDGRQGRIDMRLFQQDKDAIIEIADNGIGIPPEIQRNVFSPNFTTKNSGTGLGLAISYKIIAAHHGDIYFKTREQMGTSFYVQLPLYEI